MLVTMAAPMFGDSLGGGLAWFSCVLHRILQWTVRYINVLASSTTNMAYRMGSYITLPGKYLLRINSSNRWPYCRPIPFFNSFPRFQLRRFCKPLVQINPSRHWIDIS